MTDNKNFKAIIVGGGPVGLMAAHIFSKANIDFVILERRDTAAPDLGASLALWPQSVRIMDQLNILAPLQPHMNPMSRKTVFTHDGSVYVQSNVFEEAGKNHGHKTVMFHRATLLKTFYNTLPEAAKTRILTNKNVTSIETSDNGVIVTCDDGSVVEGSIVIGADGVHSGVRRAMRNLMLASPVHPAVDDEHPFKATYEIMFGNAARHPTLKPGSEHEAHGPNVTTQLFVGNERMWFFIYRQLAQPTSQPKHHTNQDEAAFIEQLGHIHLTKDLTLGQVYELRNGAGMANLEEGVVKRWAWERIVLVGDAAHKVTPNIGWGFNSGLQDLVVLTNDLRRFLESHDQTTVTTADLTAIFDKYQADRVEFMNKITEISGKVTRMGAWHNGLMHVLDRYLFPAISMDRWLSRHSLGPMVAKVPVLDFLAEKHSRSGKIPWLHHSKIAADVAAPA